MEEVVVRVCKGLETAVVQKVLLLGDGVSPKAPGGNPLGRPQSQSLRQVANYFFCLSLILKVRVRGR
jgi:hypothetical protein